MATGALIGGTVLGLIGSHKQAKGQKKAARMQRKVADQQYEDILESIEKSREVESTREAAEKIADDALRESNESFKRLNAAKYENSRISSHEWAAANKERYDLQLQNLKYESMERKEEMRRAKLEMDITEGRNRTRVGASGFGKGSSLHAWEGTVSREHDRQYSWMVKSDQMQNALGQADAAAMFRASESERAQFNRNSLLGYETGEAQYDFYESSREADSVMREAERQQREANREYALASAETDKMAAYAGASAMRAGANASLWSAAGGAATRLAGWNW